MDRLKRWVSSLVVGVLGAAIMPAAAMATGSGTCTILPPIAVAMGPGLPANQTVAGTLCMPTQFSDGRQIDVLVHGATYNRMYWDFPQQSYVQRTLAAGRATFAYDRLGTGASSRPLSATVTVDADAYVLHQVIGMIRSARQMAKVTVVGHSFGSIVATAESAAYHDADRVVLTGLLHGTGPGVAMAGTALYPAALDPKFFLGGYDPGWLTTVPGMRASLFYYTPGADPAVIALDEATKDVVSATQFGLGAALTQTPAGLNASNQITAPVLAISGEFDSLYCGLLLNCSNAAAVAANEAPYYTNSPSLTTSIVAGTGHDMALHNSAGTSFATINSWIQTH